MAVPGARTALVAGSSGMVGARLLPLLLNAPEYARVHALSRRPLSLEHPRIANRVVRFDQPLETQLKGLRIQDAFCCLGTTRRAAGSEAAFRAVDHDLVVSFGRVAASAGAERLVVVASVAADAGAKNFYLRVKGEMERSLEALHLRSLDILQPSLLLGVRRQIRAQEAMAQAAMWLIGPLFIGPWSRFRAIDAARVAAAMIGVARSGRLGVHRYTHDAILSLASGIEPPRL
jgi:uncharacterized protein YbjT (DUF2867 family)